MLGYLYSTWNQADFNCLVLQDYVILELLRKHVVVSLEVVKLFRLLLLFNDMKI